MSLTELAPAKINLALHIIGQYDNGYHALESLVGFTDFGDVITGQLSKKDHLQIKGPFSKYLEKHDLSQDSFTDNLIIKARNLLRQWADKNKIQAPQVALTCDKHIPVAAGIGGGSADAAATLRLLIKLWDLPIPTTDLAELALTLGADVPACLQSRPLLMEGIGDALRPIHQMPDCPILLVNPMIQISTPDIFQTLLNKDNPKISPPLAYQTDQALYEFLRAARNDLQPPAIKIAPQIANCRDMLERTDPILCRMSGSGATCFALYSTQEQAENAQKCIQQQQANWFAKATILRGVHVKN